MDVEKREVLGWRPTERLLVVESFEGLAKYSNKMGGHVASIYHHEYKYQSRDTQLSD